MSLVNGRGPQAKRCGRNEAKRKSVRKRLPLRGSRCVGDSPRKPLRHHREAATARDSAKHHREAAPQRKARHLRESNLPNQQHRDTHPAAMHHREAATARDGAKHHREADVLANNGAKWAGVEGVRGCNLACFLKNFVSNYIVIFLMMLFRVHL